MALKVCKVCCQAMSVSDEHDTCLKCLGFGHDMYGCEVCTASDLSVRNLRRSLLDAARRLGAFPDNWRHRLYPDLQVAPVATQAEVVCLDVPVVPEAPVDRPGPSVSLEVQPPPTTTAATTSVGQPKKPARKRPSSALSTSSLSAEEATDPVLLQILQNYRERKMSVGSVSVHSLESQPKPKARKRAVRKTKVVQASEETVVKVPVSQEDVPPSTSAVPDFSALLASVVPDAPVHPVPLEPVPPSPPVVASGTVENRLSSLESFMLTMQQTMSQMNKSLQDVSMQFTKRSEPVIAPAPVSQVQQPVVQPQVSQPAFSFGVQPQASDTSMRREEEDDGEPYSQAELLTLKAKRQVWLTTVREIDPDLPPPEVQESGPSSCLIGLSRQHQDVHAPLLPEIVKGLADRSKLLKPSAKHKTPFKWVPRTVSCGQKADKSLFQQRSIPRRLAAEVPSSSIDNPGTSGTDVRLKKGTKEGALDSAARVSFNQASTYVKLANSQELAIHGLKLLLDKLNLRLDLALGSIYPGH